MKILKIFQEKLRYKNYSEKSINLYTSYLKNFLEINDIKDPYQIRTQQIISFLETHQYSSTSQQNQYIGTLKLFAKYILDKKDIHLTINFLLTNESHCLVKIYYSIDEYDSSNNKLHYDIEKS